MAERETDLAERERKDAEKAAENKARQERMLAEAEVNEEKAEKAERRPKRTRSTPPAEEAEAS